MIWLAVVIAFNGVPVNDTEPQTPDTIVCDVVRWYVSRYGEKAGADWAKAHGWSRERIEEAKRCIRPKSSS